MSWLEAICTRLGLQLHPYGSYLLGTGSASSDVDAVAVGPSNLSREGFAQTLIEALPQQDESASGRFVADAAIPMVKLSLEGVHFDVSYASRPEGVEPSPPAELLARYGEQLDTAGFRSEIAGSSRGPSRTSGPRAPSSSASPREAWLEPRPSL